MADLFNIPHLLSTYGYIGVFVIVFLESGIFFLLPGDSLLFTAGLLASGLGQSIGLLIPVFFLATFLGSIAGYFIGIYIEHLHKYKIFRRILKPEHIAKAHEFYEKHGVVTLVVSRFIPIVRTFAPIVAGIARMQFDKFIRYSLVGSILWSAAVPSVGFFLGRQFPWVEDYLSYVVLLIVAVSIIPLWMKWRREKRLSKSQTIL